jgi:hypothetical protein
MNANVLTNIVTGCVAILAAFSVHSATLVVDSLADDVFPNHLGQLFDAGGNPVVLTAQKCALRMATVASNIDGPVGNLDNTSTQFYGCVAQVTSPPTLFAPGSSDIINFAPAIAGGTINLNANKGMDIDGTGEQLAMLWFTGPVSLDGSAGTSSRITLDAGATPTTNRRIMRFQELSTATRNSAGTSAWAQVLSLNLRNSRQASLGGCMFSAESVRLIDVEFSNCESANGLGGAFFAAATDTASTSFRPNVRMSRVTFKGNRAINPTTAASGQGGAFLIGTSSNGRVGHVSLSDVTVGGATLADGNTSSGQFGGGLIVNADSVTITNSRFENNVASNGGVGGLLITGTLSSAVTIVNTTFTKNSATGPVGALRINNNGSSTILLQGVDVTSNQAASIAGIEVVQNSGAIVADRLNVLQNTAVQNTGGALFHFNSSPSGITISDSSFSANRVTDGSTGGLSIGNNVSPVQLLRVAINGNQVTKGASTYAGSGGANFFNNTAVTLTDSTVNDNSSDFHVGAMAVSASFIPYDPNTGLPVTTLPPTTNTFTLERTTVSGNATTAASNGFASSYWTTPGIYRILNSTISGNSVASGCGGGLTFDGFNPSTQSNSMQVVIRNSTVARNTGQCDEALSVFAYNPAAQNQGAFSGSITLESSILGGRAFPSPSSVMNALNGIPIAATNSLLENAGGPFTAACGANGVLCAVDAKLAALGANGGTTRTLALLATSPAIDTGSNSLNLTGDQRLAARNQGAGVDMGAFESTPAGSCALDMDGVGGVQAAKEGLVLVRSMLGMTDANAVVGTGITQSQWSAVKANLNANCGTAGSFAP